MEMKTKKSLLERYDIPIHHLDFEYIKKCKDGREIEKIVHILRSNEEGYYPDLTICAEEKLKELKPNSRLFRVEEQIRGREALEPGEMKPIYEWNKTIKTTDKNLQKLVKEKPSELLNEPQMPPIRKGGSIVKVEKEKETVNMMANKKDKSSCQKIKSLDYSKWDKYDPEEEILRLKLAEEREQENVERKNRLNMEKCIKQPLTITEITDNNSKLEDKLMHLSDIEKEKLSEEYRLRGNEYFRSKEYESAIKEYTCAIECFPKLAVAAYNNRAITYIKQQRFSEAIEDCEQCLKLEPNNIKARLRLAEANYACGRRRESYQLYINVLKLDAENLVALKATTELRKQFEDLPPPNATRLQIQEESSNKNENKEKTKPIETPKTISQTKSKTINYDLADLIKPNRIVPNKLVKAAENFGKNIQNGESKTKTREKPIEQVNNDRELRLPGLSQDKMGNKLIVEL